MDVSSNTALTYLYCYGNQFTNLDVRSNTALKLLYCYSNQLTSLDVSSNTALITLYCNGNQLTNLDVSSNTALTYLRCYSNHLTSLDVSSNTALKHLTCYSNYLTSLDVSSNTALTYLSCYSNHLTSLDVSSNTALTELSCNVNQLTSLNLKNGNNSNMTDMVATSNPNLSCIQVDDVSNTPPTGATWIKDAGASYGNNCHFGETYVPDDNFEAYLETNAMGNGTPNDDYVTTANISSVLTLDVSGKSIANLTGIEDFTALTELNCASNQLTSLNVTSNSALSFFYCNDNQLTSLDISSNTALNEINCASNQLTSLDVNSNTALIGLNCASNQLTSLDISSNTALYGLYCYSNQLTSLNVTSNSALTLLHCDSNQLTSLNISSNTALTWLGCYSNQLTSLDVSSNTALSWLYCGSNQLTNLDVSSNTALIGIYCGSNQLTSLDVSSNTALSWLYCENNQLTNLDVSSNTALNELYCASNQLTSLDISSNTALYELYCYSNQLTRLNLKNGNNSNMTDMDATSNPSLSCIQVDDATNTPPPGATWTKDAGASYSDNCHYGETYVPDDNFEAYLEANGMGNGTPNDDYVTTANISSVTTLDVSGKSIADLTGIEDFTALTHIECQNNLISSLDLTYNTNLNHLECWNNNMTNLNVNSNINLTHLECWDNNLTSLDVTNNQNLESLYCSINSLSSLNVGNNTNLTLLECAENSLNTLDVSFNSLLTHLNCSDNSITNLDLTNNAALVELDCNNNSLTSLNIGNNLNLTSLNCANNSLADLDVSSNISLTNLLCQTNSLTGLNLKNGHNTTLATMNATSNPSLTCIQVDDATSTPPTGTTWTKDAGATYSNVCLPLETYVPDNNFEAYLEANGMGNGITNDDYVTTANISGVTTLDVSNNNIADLTGIENFISITNLNCAENSITNLDVSSNTLSTNINCSYNFLTNLDVSSNVALTKLECGANSITNLNTGTNTNLTELQCAFNALTSIDISNNTALLYLNCNANVLVNLNLSSNSNLETLWCSMNNLTNLNLSSNTNLKDLDCTNNNFATVDVSHNVALERLVCGNNTSATIFSSLNLSANTNLVTLICYVTSITNLDLSHNTNLQYIEFYQNEVTNLDVSPCVNLVRLDCSGNLLTNLNITGCTSLTHLVCNMNALTSLDVSSYTSLENLSCYSNALTQLNVAGCTNLVGIDCKNNSLTSIDVSTCSNLEFLECNSNALTSLYINTNIKGLNCNNNQLPQLDVSNNTALIEIDCEGNQLTSLNLKNGNNTNMWLEAVNNPHLTCINVDNEAWAVANWSGAGIIDPHHSFSETCCHANPSTTWNGVAWSNGAPTPTTPVILAGSYDTSLYGNLNACNCNIQSGAILTIDDGDYIIVDDNFTNNGTITVSSEGSFVQTGEYASVTGGGSFTQQKTTTTYIEHDFTYWSSPVQNVIIADVFAANNPNRISELITANFDDTYGGSYPQTTGAADAFDDNADDWQLVPGITDLVAGKGYITEGPGTGTNLTQSVAFNGTPNTGTIRYSVSLDSNPTDAFTNQNLIGNPYASGLDAASFLTENNTVLNGTLYFWTHNTGASTGTPGPQAYNFTNNDYATYVLGTGGVMANSGGVIPTGTIASCQGFLADVSVAGDVVFKNAMRTTTGNDNFYSPRDIEADRVWLDMTNADGVFSQILIGFFDEATEDHDKNYDAKRLFSGANYDFSSLLNETDYAIQGLPVFEENRIIPLSVKAPETGLLRIEIHDVEGIFHTQDIYIYDYEMNVLHNLKESPYQFNITEPGRYTERFELRFTDNTTGIANVVLNSVAVYPNPSEGQFTISWNGEDNLRIQITDMSGKLIIDNTNIDKSNKPYSLDMSNYESGIYFMRISVNETTAIKKLIVK